MKASKFILFVTGIILTVFSLSVNAQSTTTTTTVVDKKIIVTPAPKSAKCTTVNAHWEDNVWFDTQTVCSYENRTEGVAWVQDYWACTTFTADGNCTTWEYRPGHWIKTSNGTAATVTTTPGTTTTVTTPDSSY